MDWDGAELLTESVAEGNAATAPANPAREGFTFTGWDTDFSNVTSNLTVRARYRVDNYVEIVKTKTTPILDGIEEDFWNNVEANPINKDFGGETPTLESYWKAAWCDTGLFVLINVIDDDHYPAWEAGSDEFWMYDGAEVYFDINEKLDDGGGASGGNGHYQSHPAFASDQYGVKLNHFVSSNMPGGQYAYQLNGENWVREQFFPFSNFVNNDGMTMNRNSFITMDSIGFDIIVLDQDEGITITKHSKVWQNSGEVDHNWNNMDDAGVIKLVGEDDANILSADFIFYTPKGSSAFEKKFFDTSFGNPSVWVWDFGDGTSSTEQNPIHIYQEEGTYSVSLKIKDNEQNEEIYIKEIIIENVYELWEFIDYARVFSATGSNWLDVDDYYHQQGTDWYESNGLGYFRKSFNYVNSISKYGIVAPPDYYDLASATVGQYQLFDPGYIKTSYGIIDNNSLGNVRFVLQIQTDVITTILDTIIDNSSQWNYFEYDLSQWANDTITIRMITDPNGVTWEDAALWGEPIVSAQKLINYSFQPVNCSFKISNNTGIAPMNVHFTDQSTGNPTSWLWDFGDGGTSTEQNPDYTYNNPGVYDIELVISNGAFSDILRKENYISVSENDCPQHFQTVWEGAGYDQMNINIKEAKLNNLDLEPGDEIGVFDGDLCVGYGKVEQTVDETNFLGIILSKNDGDGNGYTPGNNISYKIWDCSEMTEYNVQDIQCFNTLQNPVACSSFAPGTTTFVALGVFSTETQQIVLNQGWNIMSLRVMPENPVLKDILQPVINEGKLKKVMDESGKIIEDWGTFGGWRNTIGNLECTEGYKINVTSSATIEVEGVPVQFPYDIALRAGWNIISWPSGNEQNGIVVFDALITGGELKKVMDETGKVIEDWGSFGGWQNYIGNLKPAEGYNVNVNEDCILTINESGPKSVEIIADLIPATHFVPAYIGNGTDHMNINLVNLTELGILEGDEIGIFDGNICVGSATVSTQNSTISIPVSATDGIESKNGFSNGNTVKIKLFRNGKEFPVLFEPFGNSKTTFEKGSTLFAQFAKSTNIWDFINEELTEVKCYPNPFNDEVNIEFNLANDSEVTIEVINQMGQKVNTLVHKQIMMQGLNRLTWNGMNNLNHKVSSGIYYLKGQIGDFSFYEKLVFSR